MRSDGTKLWEGDSAQWIASMDGGTSMPGTKPAFAPTSKTCALPWWIPRWLTITWNMLARAGGAAGLKRCLKDEALRGPGRFRVAIPGSAPTTREHELDEATHVPNGLQGDAADTANTSHRNGLTSCFFRH